MTIHVHFVGSIGLDSAEEVFSTVGSLLGDRIKRCPDGEVGGRRLWVSWQYPLLRSSPYLEVDYSKLIPGVGMCSMKLADDVRPEEVHFGELGYAREAIVSYMDFLKSRERGELSGGVRFQVSLPTPYAILSCFILPESIAAVEPAYEQAMIREVEKICASIPHDDLAIQWDVCMEMIMWDGRTPFFPPFPGMEKVLAEKFERLCAPLPAAVELGFHLCYGDMDAKHFIEPENTGKAVGLANLLMKSAGHQVNWIHMPVPVDRDDDAYFEPLKDLHLNEETDLFLGLVHAGDGAEGTKRRMATAGKFVKDFGIATECGIARLRTPELVRQLLQVHADAAE